MKRRKLLGNFLVTFYFAFLALPFYLFGQSESIKSEQQKPEDRFSIKVNVDLVVLNLTVVDGRGNNVTNLKREDFSVFEDEVQQDLSDFHSIEAPFHLVLVLDTSISTRTSLSLIKKAASNFADELRPSDSIAVAEVNFFARQTQDFTSDRKIVRKAIQSLATYPYGGSKVYDGVSLAAKQLQGVEGGRKAIVILSDGMENFSGIKFEDLRRLLAQGDAVFYPITIQNKDRQKDLLESYIRTADSRKPENAPIIKNARESLSVLEEVYQIQTERLQTLADETGGKIFFVSDLADLAGEYSKVAQELRNTFSLAYYSKNSWRDGTMRRIRVEVNNPNYRVRTRTAYYVPKE
jgi:Ca-activated chloride channel family protein